MKIIKPGVKKSWSITQTCTGKGNEGSGCGAELEIEEGDVFITTRSCYDETENCYTFRCPQCECDTDIAPLKLPLRIQGAAKRNGKPLRRGESGPRD